MIVLTKSGAQYRVEGDTICRLSPEDIALRQDGDILDVIGWIQRPEVGKPMTMVLPVLSPHVEGMSVTVRQSTPVVYIREDTQHWSATIPDPLPAAIEALVEGIEDQHP